MEIVYTGLREAEKLHEELFSSGETDRRPLHPLISHVDAPPLLAEQLPNLGDLPQAGRVVEVLERLAASHPRLVRQRLKPSAPALPVAGGVR